MSMYTDPIHNIVFAGKRELCGRKLLEVHLIKCNHSLVSRMLILACYLDNHIAPGKILRGALFIVRALNDIIKADFMHTRRNTFPTEMKIGI